MISELKSLFT